MCNVRCKGGILKIRRAPLHYFYKIGKSLSLLLLIPYLSVLLFVDQAMGNPSPVWTFDFRDSFYEIVYVEKDKAVMIGARGRILVTHPKYNNLWSPRPSMTKELLTCLDFIDNKNGWAAGHAGVIIHTADGGESWEVQKKASMDNQPILDIQFPSKEVGYACGAFDSFFKTTDGGKTWKSIPTGTDNIYNCLVFIDENKGYMVGEYGTVLLTRDGAKSWEKLDLGGYEGSFFGITLVSEKRLLIYGVAGKIMKSENSGQTWENLPLGIDQPLFRGAVNGDKVVIVGGAGTILISHDQGNTFTKKIDKGLKSFAGVGVHPEGGFVCVGEWATILPLKLPLD